MNIGKLLRKAAGLVPLLKLFGVKDKTTAAKVGKGIVIVDEVVNEPKDSGKVIVGVLFAVTFYIVLVHQFLMDFIGGNYGNMAQP